MSIPEFWSKWLHLFYDKVKDNLPLSHQSDESSNSGSSVPASKTAVIIEPRKHPLMKYVLANFMYFLIPKGWKFQIFCGTDNRDWLESQIPWKEQYSGSRAPEPDIIEITQLPYNNLNEIMYNILLTNSGFWKSIYNNPEHVLIFQTDCLLFKNDVEDYLKYDMIGAPWKHSPYRGCNGGFSLRNRKEMIRICEENQYKYENEDGWFSYTNADKLKLPDLKDKMKFSMETLYSPNSTGMHAAYKHHFEEDIIKILEKHFDNIFNEKIKLKE